MQRHLVTYWPIANMGLTVPYYFDKQLGVSLNTAEGWGIVRLSDTSSPYTISSNRETWIKDASRSFAKNIGYDIADFLRTANKTAAISIGVGCGFNEYNMLLSYPSLDLTCTEFSEAILRRLQSVFEECTQYRVLDMRRDPIPRLNDGIAILCRVDNELSHDEWVRVFEQSQSDEILLVCCGEISIWRALCQIKDNFFKFKKGSFAGYKRTKTAIEALYSKSYDCLQKIEIGSLPAYWLRKKTKTDKMTPSTGRSAVR